MVNLKLAYLRVIRRGSQLGIAVAFIALVQATFLITNAALPVVEAEAVSQKVESLTAADKWLTVNLGDPTKLGDAQLDELASQTLESLGAIDVMRLLAFRPVSDKASGRFQLVASDQVGQQIELSSGRLPQACDETACEVVVIDGDGLTQVPDYVEVVGTGSLKADSPIATTVEPGISLLISNDISTVAKSPNFVGFPGTQLWSSPITIDQIQQVGLARFIDQTDRASSGLAVANGRLQLIAPLGALEQTRVQVAILFNRILSLELSLCLIGSFAILLFARSSRAANLMFVNAARRIQRRRVSGFQISLFIALFVSALGVVAGYLLAGAISLVAGNYLATPAFGLDSLILLFSSVGLLFAGLNKSRSIQVTGTLISVGLWASYVSRHELQTQVTAIALVCALGSFALLWALTFLIRNKFIKNIFLSNRQWVMTVCVSSAFLASALISGTTYLSSLEQNARDNAIFKSPMLTRVTVGGEARPMQNNDLADFAQLADSEEVFAIRKVSATYRQNAFNSFPTLIVGADPEVWEFVPDVTNQTGFDLKCTEDLFVEQSWDLGPDLAGVATLSLTATGLDKNALLSAWIINDRSESLQVELVQSGDQFVGQLPDNATNLLGFQITEEPDFKSRREHAVNEGKNSLVVPTGTISIADLRFDEAAAANEYAISSEYSLINGPEYFSYVTAPSSILAVTDPETAQAVESEQVQLTLAGKRTISIEPVATAQLLQTVPMRFALVDPQALTAFLAATNPEMLRIAEVWMNAQFAESQLASDKLYGLTVIDQQQVRQANFAPSNAAWSKRGIQLLALSAALLFVLVISYAVRRISNDPQIFGWRASGKSISKLQNQLGTAMFVIAFIGLIGAVVLSYFLLPIYIEELAYDINASVAYPPLVTTWDRTNLGVVVGGLLVTSFVVTKLNSLWRIKRSGATK